MPDFNCFSAMSIIRDCSFNTMKLLSFRRGTSSLKDSTSIPTTKSEPSGSGPEHSCIGVLDHHGAGNAHAHDGLVHGRGRAVGLPVQQTVLYSAVKDGGYLAQSAPSFYVFLEKRHHDPVEGVAVHAFEASLDPPTAIGSLLQEDGHGIAAWRRTGDDEVLHRQALSILRISSKTQDRRPSRKRTVSLSPA